MGVNQNRLDKRLCLAKTGMIARFHAGTSFSRKVNPAKTHKDGRKPGSFEARFFEDVSSPEVSVKP